MPGAFKCAVRANCPIVPVLLVDSYKPFEINSLRRVKTQVHFLPAIYPEEYEGLTRIRLQSWCETVLWMQCSKKRVHKNIRGKEEVRLMDINQVLMDYDNMFGTHSLEDIEEFLTTNIEVAMDERDYASALSLLNEMMGLCRDTNQNAKGLRYCADIETYL